MYSWTRAWLCLPLASLALAAAVTPCDPNPAAQKALDKHLDEYQEKYRFLNHTERMAWERKTLEDLLRQYPGEMAIERRYIDLFKYNIPDELPALQKRYRERAARNPHDPAALYAAGVALQGYDTPEALRLLERARQLDPAFGWPYLSLANTYGSGKFADKAKAEANIAAYFHACPASTVPFALSLLNRFGARDVQAAVARRLRERLAAQSDPKKLRAFSDVWSLEFRTRPVAEHPALRRQVAEDVNWLEPRNSKPDAEWLDFLKGGYKQSGASREIIGALEDRVLKEFPSSDQALSIVRERWRKDHPEPKATDSAETWDKYLRAQIAAYEEWIKRFPKADYLQSMLFYSLTSLDPVPLERVTALGEELLKTYLDRWGPEPYPYTQLAQFYLKHNLQPERALALARQAAALDEKEWSRRLARDDLSAKQLEDYHKYQGYSEQTSQHLLLLAYRALNRVEDARALKPKLEGPVPADKGQVPGYWEDRAIEAAIEGHQTDALTFYQAALNARARPPDKRFGRTEDTLLEDARKVYLSAGGTEAAWTVWSQRPSKPASATDARWEKPGKEMAGFELADLTGNTWSLKRLEGRTVLIAVWASW